MTRALIGAAVFAALLLVFGLTGESDRRSAIEARHMAALIHLGLAREAGR